MREASDEEWALYSVQYYENGDDEDLNQEESVEAVDLYLKNT